MEDFFDDDFFHMHHVEEQHQAEYYNQRLHDYFHSQAEMENQQGNSSNEDNGYDADDDDAQEEEPHQDEEAEGARASREMTVDEKRLIVDDILLNMEGVSLPKGYLSNLVRKHNVHKSITTTWFQVIKQHLLEGNVIDVLGFFLICTYPSRGRVRPAGDRSIMQHSNGLVTCKTTDPGAAEVRLRRSS